MTIQRTKIKIISVLSLMLVLLPITSLAAGEPRLVLSAESVQGVLAQELVVELWVEEASPTLKVATHLTFDPAALQAVKVEHGDFLTVDPDINAFVLQNDLDNQAGAIHYEVLLNPNQAPAEGSGLLATIIFQVQSDSVATIAIEEGRFFDPNGLQVLAKTDSASVAVRAEKPVEVNTYQEELEAEPAPQNAVAETPTDPAPVVEVQPEVGLATEQATTPTTPQIALVEPTQPAPVVELAAEQPLTAEVVADVGPDSIPARTELSPLEGGRFRTESQITTAQNPSLTAWLLLGLALIMVFIGLIGLAMLVGGWIWARRIRARRRIAIRHWTPPQLTTGR